MNYTAIFFVVLSAILLGVPGAIYIVVHAAAPRLKEAYEGPSLSPRTEAAWEKVLLEEEESFSVRVRVFERLSLAGKIPMLAANSPPVLIPPEMNDARPP